MPGIYRGMLSDGGKPALGASGKMLGVRTPPANKVDITPDQQGNVFPGTGGMSVAPSLQTLPTHRVPKRLKHVMPDANASSQLHVWRLSTNPFINGNISDRLALRVTSPEHGQIEPSGSMSISEYEAALAATRDDWMIDESGT